MKHEYCLWIRENVQGTGAGLCNAYSKDMCKAFPELTLVRGWYGPHPHWWCKTLEGEIVDPTINQFSETDCEYREFREGVDPEPLGKCMNCGEWVWSTTTWCPEEEADRACEHDRCFCCWMCQDDYVAEYNRSLR